MYRNQLELLKESVVFWNINVILDKAQSPKQTALSQNSTISPLKYESTMCVFLAINNLSIYLSKYLLFYYLQTLCIYLFNFYINCILNMQSIETHFLGLLWVSG